jgi:hypothetical protein
VVGFIVSLQKLTNDGTSGSRHRKDECQNRRQPSKNGRQPKGKKKAGQEILAKMENNQKRKPAKNN